MILDILPLAGGTARLVRVYGGEPCVKLPGAVPAPEGEGQWPITELGDYCFSEGTKSWRYGNLRRYGNLYDL